MINKIGLLYKSTYYLQIEEKKLNFKFIEYFITIIYSKIIRGCLMKDDGLSIISEKLKSSLNLKSLRLGLEY